MTMGTRKKPTRKEPGRRKKRPKKKKSIITALEKIDQLARECGYDVQVVIKAEKAPDYDEAQPTETHQERWCREFARLENYLTTEDGFDRLRGNYVAVHDSMPKPVAIGPNRMLVSLAAEMKLGLSHEKLLIVPIAVPGSEEDWEDTKRSLGIE